MAQKSRKKTSRLNLSDLSTPNSYTSLIYGAISVLIIFVIIFVGLKLISQRSKGEISKESVSVTNQAEEKTYEVKEGDSLWTISEQNYKSGYNWVEIAKANKIENPDVIVKGTKLTLPKLEEKKVVAETDSVVKVETKDTVSDGKITGEKYTVVEGDSLWTISVRAYGDGYKWEEIAKVNKLVNPNLIHPGNVLQLPR